MTTRGDNGQRPQLTVVIGANGAGKTTWTIQNKVLLPERFYNADSIAAGLGDSNSFALQMQAREIVDKAILANFGNNLSFGFESTYSGASRPGFVGRARSNGYEVRGIFVGTHDAEINIRRVRSRVEAGGHDIPTEEIIRRWHTAPDNLIATWKHFDALTLIDNSGMNPSTAAKITTKGIETSEHTPQWAKDILDRAAQAAKAGQRE